MSNDTGTIAEERMNARMNETYSLLGDSWLEMGTKTYTCVSMNDVMVMKHSGPSIPGFVHYAGPSLFSVSHPPPPPLSPLSAPGRTDFRDDPDGTVSFRLLFWSKNR